jgi:hypothetical protein
MINIIFVILLLGQIGWAHSAEIKAPTSVTTTVLEQHPVVGQKVTINYLLAVKGYFNGATVFQLPSLSKGRLSQASEFAVNGSSIIDGEQYATQLWQIDLYPEQQGLLTLPTLNFTVQYKNDQDEQQSATVQSDSIMVFTYLPEPLQQVESYLVSTDVSLSETWSDPHENYQIGDIIQRDINIQARDVSSIQIPHIHFKAIDGIQINVQEPKLQDKSNRGEQTASLTQTVTYVVEQAGHYSLGGEKLYWWHLKYGLKEESFEVQTIRVAGINAGQVITLIILGMILLMILLCVYKISKMPPSLHKQLKTALKNKQWNQFISLLYQQLDKDDGLALLKARSQGDAASLLLMKTYQDQQKVADINLSTSQLKELIK